MDDKLPTRRSDVAIIGAGFSGINIACQLQRKLGVTDYVIYDRHPTLGVPGLRTHVRPATASASSFALSLGS